MYIVLVTIIKQLDIYNCKHCNYSTKNKSDYLKHLNTKKHMNRVGKAPNVKKQELYICENWGREYKYRTGLSRHLRTCGKEDIKNAEVHKQQAQIMNLQKLLEKTIVTQNDTLNNLMNKVGNTTNNYNNQMTITTKVKITNK